MKESNRASIKVQRCRKNTRIEENGFSSLTATTTLLLCAASARNRLVRHLDNRDLGGLCDGNGKYLETVPRIRSLHESRSRRNTERSNANSCARAKCELMRGKGARFAEFAQRADSTSRKSSRRVVQVFQNLEDGN